MKHTYKKAERLKSRKLIAELYQKGQMVKSYPFRIKYLWHGHQMDSKLQGGVSVSKRHFKRAVDRNRVKRLLREAYRLENEELKDLCKHEDSPSLALMIMYSSSEIPTLAQTQKAVRKLLKKLVASTPTDKSPN